MITVYTTAVHEINISCTEVLLRCNLCPFTRTYVSKSEVKQQSNKL